MLITGDEMPMMATPVYVNVIKLGRNREGPVNIIPIDAKTPEKISIVLLDHFLENKGVIKQATVDEEYKTEKIKDISDRRTPKSSILADR